MTAEVISVQHMKNNGWIALVQQYRTLHSPILPMQKKYKYKKVLVYHTCTIAV